MAWLHPIFPLVIRRPDLVVDHLGGYIALLREESASAGASLLRRGIALALGVFLLAAFVGLAGGAIMLGAVLDRFSWALIVVPVLTLILVAAALWVALRPLPGPLFAELQAQLDADRRILKAAGDEPDEY